MTMQFGGGIGAVSFTAAPTSGVPTLQLGTGTFSGGAQPDFQGVSALGANMAAGYANNLFDFQVAGVSKIKCDSSGSLTAVGNVSAATLLANGGLTFFSANFNVLAAPGAAKNGALIKGAASQTADIVTASDSGSVNQFGVANVGTGGAPIWALRVAPVANAASMAQAHVGGASTGKAIQVIDNSGTTLGWLQLLA